MDVGGGGAEVVALEYMVKRDEGATQGMIKDLKDIAATGLTGKAAMEALSQTIKQRFEESKRAAADLKLAMASLPPEILAMDKAMANAANAAKNMNKAMAEAIAMNKQFDKDRASAADSSMSGMLTGAVAGGVAALVTQGLDLIKSALMAVKDLAVEAFQAIVDGLIKSVGQAVEFEKVMTRIKVLSNSSAEDMKLYNDQILAMAPAVGVGPQKLVEALERITSLGTTGADAMAILETSAKLSAVGMGEASTIATALTGVINSYGKENITAAQAADVLTATVREGGAEANAYAGTLGRVAPLAAQLGISFADLGANLAAFTRLGVSASEATTGISSFMTAMIHETKGGNEALASVGMTYAKVRAQIQDQGLAQTMVGLMKAFEGNDAMLSKLLPNVRALRDALATAGAQGEEYIAIQGRIRDSSGDAADAFKATTETAAFQFASMQAAVESAGLAIGQALLPSVQKVAVAVGSDLIPIMENLVSWFTKNREEIESNTVKALEMLRNALAGGLVEFEKMKAALEGLAGSPITAWIKEQAEEWLYLDDVLAKLTGGTSFKKLMELGQAKRNADYMASLPQTALGDFHIPGGVESQAYSGPGEQVSKETFDAMVKVREELVKKRAADEAAAEASKHHAEAMKEAAKEAKAQAKELINIQISQMHAMQEAERGFEKDDRKQMNKEAHELLMGQFKEEILAKQEQARADAAASRVYINGSEIERAIMRGNMMDEATAYQAHLKANKLQIETLEALKKAHPEMKKYYQDQIDGLKRCNEEGSTWRENVSAIGQGLSMMGDKMGGTAGSVVKLFGAMSAGAANYGKQLTTAEKIQAGFQAAAAAWDIYQTNKEKLNGGAAAMNGAATGAQAGAAFGPYGMIIGAVVGGLLGFFSGSKFRDMAHAAGRTLGFEISEELAKAIAKTMKDLKVDVKTASLLNLDKAMAEGPQNVTFYKKQIAELMVGIAAGSIPAKQGIEQLGKAFMKVTEAAQAGDKAAQKMLALMMQEARATGVKVPEITAAVKAALDVATKGMQDFAENFTIASPEDAKAEAMIFSSIFWAKVKEDGIVAAGQAMLPAWKAMQQALDDAGIDPKVTAAILAPMQGIMDILGDEKLAKIIAGLDGATRAVKGLSDAGYMTQGAFEGLQQVAQSTYAQLIAGGADANAALMALAPTLAQIISDHERYGTVIDDATQKLIDEAKAAGIAFPTDPLLQVVDLLGELVILMGGTLPESVNRASEAYKALGQAARDAANAANSVNGPSGGSGEGGGPKGNGGEGGPGYARGGTVNAPESGQNVTVHGLEHIMRPEQFQSYLSAAMAQAGKAGMGGGGPVTVVVQLDGQRLGQAVVDMRRRGSAAFGKG